MFDKIVKFVKTIASLDLKKIISVFVLISMISGGIIWMQTTYVSANDFEEYVIVNNHKWAKIELERINDQIYYWAKKVDADPNDEYAKRKLDGLRKEEILLASDPNAFLGHDLNVVYLRKDEIASISKKEILISLRFEVSIIL